MREFRVVSNDASNRDQKIRLLVWGSVITLSGITVFALYCARSASPELNETLAVFAVLIVAAVIVGAQYLASSLGIERMERDLIFVLTEKELTRRRAGWPDVRINLSEVSSLCEQPASLVVESLKSRSRIVVPKKVDGFVELRAELVKHSPILFLSPRGSLWGLISTLASVFCWGLVLVSKDMRVLRISGTVALTLLGWETLRLARKLRRSPTKIPFWIFVGIGWLVAMLVIYLRLVRNA